MAAWASEALEMQVLLLGAEVVGTHSFVHGVESSINFAVAVSQPPALRFGCTRHTSEPPRQSKPIAVNFPRAERWFAVVCRMLKQKGVATRVCA